MRTLAEIRNPTAPLPRELVENLAKAEANKVEKCGALSLAQKRYRDQASHVAMSLANLEPEKTENEHRREAMAEAAAEDVPYQGQPLHDIAAREAEVAEKQLVLDKMKDVRARKNREDNDATRALYAAESLACAREIERRGWTGFREPRWPVATLAPFTLAELVEIECLLARAEMRAPSLAGFLSRIAPPDWHGINAVGRALQAARDGEKSDADSA